MKHSGVAITITSLTDLLAFGIGATSILPALGTFCAYAAFGIFAVFIYMASFFLAWLVIDQRRIDARRDGCICCWKKSDSWNPNECSQKSLMDSVFKKCADFLVMFPVKITILIITFVLLGASIYGVSEIQSNFDFVDWFPEDSYVTEYFMQVRKYFPSGGIQGKVYVVEVPNIEAKLLSLNKLLENVGNVPDLKGNRGVQSFLPEFLSFLNTKQYLNTFKTIDLNNRDLTEVEFRKFLKDFICGQRGRKWRGDIKYVAGEKLNCESATMTPVVRVMTFGYQHNA